jgi:phosphate transport system substrate-binding protein
MKITVWAACLLGVICTASIAAEPLRIRIGGGGAACKTVFSPIAKAFEAKNGIVLAINPTTPGQGLIELNNGQIDVAASAHPLEWMVRMAEKSGVTINANLFKVRQIGTNRTLIFTHKTNKVKRLSKKQLKDIFTGRITNWKRVGGADLPIIVVWGLATPGQNELFTKLILDDAMILKNHRETTNYRKIKDFIAKTPGAIGINPEGFVTDSTRNPKIPTIISPVIAVTKGPPSPEAEKLFSYIIKHKK